MRTLMHTLMHTLMQLSRSLSVWEPLPDQLPSGCCRRQVPWVLEPLSAAECQG